MGSDELEAKVFKDGLYGGFLKLGVPFGGPHNKNYSILGSILGYPNFGKLPYGGLYRELLQVFFLLRWIARLIIKKSCMTLIYYSTIIPKV